MHLRARSVAERIDDGSMHVASAVDFAAAPHATTHVRFHRADVEAEKTRDDGRAHEVTAAAVRRR